MHCYVAFIDRKKCQLEYGEKQCLQKHKDTPIKNEVYLFKPEFQILKYYNSKFGDNRICKCGKEYYLHFSNGEASCDFVNCGKFIEK